MASTQSHLHPTLAETVQTQIDILVKLAALERSDKEQSELQALIDELRGVLAVCQSKQ